jgi:hypothetical protein
MREETDALEYGFAGIWSHARSMAHNSLRAFASIGFVLIAVGAIQFQEHMSPTLDRLAGVAAAGAAKTIRVANLAVMSAALPFFIRG